MREHLIRLRGGWEEHTRTGAVGGESIGRVALPRIWPRDAPRLVRLVRSFQAPPIDPRRELLGLRLDEVPGLLAVELNGRVLTLPPADAEPLWLPIDEALHPRRNLLALDVEPPSPSTDRPWGHIALVVRVFDAEEDPSA